MVGLIAFTLVVGAGDRRFGGKHSAPLPTRPESGSCVGIVLGGGGAPTCAKPHMANMRIEAATPIRTGRRNFRSESFHLFCLCLSLANELFLRIISEAPCYFSRAKLCQDSTSSPVQNKSWGEPARSALDCGRPSYRLLPGGSCNSAWDSCGDECKRQNQRGGQLCRPQSKSDRYISPNWRS